MTNSEQPPQMVHTLSVEDRQAGLRLDKWLAEHLPAFSRSRLKALIETGQVTTIDRKITDASQKVRKDETYFVHIPPPEPATPQPQKIDLSIFFEDEHLIVINKPAGLVTHPAAGNPDNTLVNALLHHCAGSLSGIGGVRRPGIVHRLDKDTSGLVVAAKSDRAHQGLAEQFRLHSITRAYQAVCWGMPVPRQGEIHTAIGRSNKDRKKMAVVQGGGKDSLTAYRVLRSFGLTASLIECRLATGRTHQIRVHLSFIGHPLIGDQIYGAIHRNTRVKLLDPTLQAMLKQFPRQALHAYLLGFNHPITGKDLSFQCNAPNDFNDLVCMLETL